MTQANKIGWSLSLEELETLRAAQGGLEFAQARLTIRASRGGELPPNWGAEVIDSGLIARKIEEWNGPGNTFLFNEWNKETLSS